MQVKQIQSLREKTGAGMMLCKQALEASDGDETRAMTWLRQKGIALAENTAGRNTPEGTVSSYIHTGGKVGVLLEVNCETDFVARSPEFQSFVRELAMQIAACSTVRYVSVEEIPEAVLLDETRIEMGREDLLKKPEQIRAKIVDGRVAKRFQELSLMDQPYIKDSNLTISEFVKQFSGRVKENIRVKRFARFTLGESE